MESVNLQRKLYIFIIVVASVTLILIFIPFIEEWLRQSIFSQYNLGINAEDEIVSTTGGQPHQLAVILLGLIVNSIRIIKIILLITIVITIIKFIMAVIFGTALKNSTQYEISSLLKTVLSVIIYI